ncbi:diguanylate cyclase [Pantoea septica]|uniref:diguanylate cyclase n=1 Tax=Pantoea septica TaxID=472695 RepID=UPI0028D49ADB|nr:diguanylate cyclase [Pantoea septica]
MTLIDIDHFKQVNDKYGHTTGDAVLRELGSLLSLNSRSQDKTYRFGGEEFILLHVCDSDAAFNATLERLMAQIRAHNFITPTGTLQITVTCGAVHAVGDEALQTLIEKADRAMYLGKQQGRDRIIFCPHKNQAASNAGEAICW